VLTHVKNMLNDSSDGRPFQRRGTHDNEASAGDEGSGTTNKLEFLKFNGKGDPLPWLNCCERFFHLRRTPDDQKVAYATFNHLDDAQLWFDRLELNSGQPTWQRFVQFINSRFRPQLIDNSVGELVHLKRDGSIDDFYNCFVVLSCRELTLTEPLQVQLFIAGLGPPLRIDVALLQSVSLEEALKFVRAYEQRLGTPAPSL
jgi:hypothetical protein